MRGLLLALVALVLPLAARAQDHPHHVERVAGVVLDASNGEAIPLATVAVVSTTRGVAADVNGHFRLELGPDDHMLRVSAVGYESLVVHVTGAMRSDPDIILRLQPTVISHREVVVQAAGSRVNDPAASPDRLGSTEDLLDRLPGADFLQRGGFAWEPVIRGMSGGQVGIVIDGMKVVGACIDKMDPTSAYVEVENLEKLELTKGGFDLSHASQIGGTINFVTERPSFDHREQFSAETGAESAAGALRTRFVAGATRGPVSVRGSFSYRQAGDFRAGGGETIATSGYRKNNMKLDAAFRPSAAHRLTASYLGDNAWDVGYPALLMDATLAEARIMSVDYAWTPTAGRMGEVSARVYRSTVDHWMDDFDRDVTDRPVMRGMYMPMAGNTHTTGAIVKTDGYVATGRLGLTLDLGRTTSFGDMWMFSVFPSVPDMHLVNLGDLVQEQGALVADYALPISKGVSARMNARLDVATGDVRDAQAASVLRGRWDLDDLARRRTTGSGSLTLEWSPSPLSRLRLGVAHVARMPTHVESYGLYVYNYVDGYFYTGNPDLSPERSSQVEVGYEHWSERLSLRASVFANYVRDYILGSTDSGLAESNGEYRFRVYRNATAASLTGFELSASYLVAASLSAAGTAAYTYGQNLEVHEPLYLVPPLTGTFALRWERASWHLESEVRWALPQNRVARIVAKEDGTDGYALLNLRGSRALGDRWKVVAGVDNVFDTLYHEHLSFGNLPSFGRNVHLSLAFGL